MKFRNTFQFTRKQIYEVKSKKPPENTTSILVFLLSGEDTGKLYKIHLFLELINYVYYYTCEF